MANKWILCLALVLTVGAFGFSTGALAEQGPAEEGAGDLPLATCGELQASTATEGTAATAPAADLEAGSMDLFGPSEFAPVPMAFVPCQWGKICRRKADCGNAGYCDLGAGGPHTGLCGCY